MKAALIISERDNVATALEALAPGRVLEIDGRTVTVAERIPPGHKIALTVIERGQPVIKYGSSIGTATAKIPAGAHVHTHNLASSRGRGDVARHTPVAGSRLAEPPDDLSEVEGPPIPHARRSG